MSRLAHASPGSWAYFCFPQNSFVWENKKIDSRPPNHETVSHAFQQAATLDLPCTSYAMYDYSRVANSQPFPVSRISLLPTESPRLVTTPRSKPGLIP
jgi:hypothetical protein